MVVDWSDDESSLVLIMQQRWQGDTVLGVIPANADAKGIEATIRHSMTSAQDQLKAQGVTPKVITEQEIQKGIKTVETTLGTVQRDVKQG